MYDIHSGAAPRRLLRPDMPSDDVEGMWLGGFSPSGARLALFWLIDGDVRAGVYEFASDTLRTFEFVPDIPPVILNRGGPAAPLWINDEELIYRTLPAGSRPAMPDLRRGMGRQLMALWEDAWRGDKPTATVSRTRSNGNGSELQAGALVRVSARSGEAKTLAAGRFFDFALSPDKRRLTAQRRGAVLSYDRESAREDITTGLRLHRFEQTLIDLRQPGVPLSVLPGFNVAEGSVVWSADGASFSFFAWPERGARSDGRFYLFRLDRDRPEPLTHAGLQLIEQSELAEPPHLAAPFAGGVILPAHEANDSAEAPGFPLTDPATYSKPPQGRVDWFWLSTTGERRKLTGELGDVSPQLVATVADGAIIAADGALWKLKPDELRPAKAASLPAGSLRNVRVLQSAIIADVVGAREGIAVIDIETGRTRLIDGSEKFPGQVATASSVSGAVVLHRRASGHTPGALSVVSQRTGHTFWRYSERLAQMRLPRSVRIPYVAADGEEAFVTVLLPHEWRPGRLVPAVVEIYPGMPTGIFSAPAHYPLELLTSWGYAVIRPEKSVEAYRFHLLREDRNPLGGWAEIVEPAIDAAIEAGYVDGRRVAGYGTSQGSWSILALLQQTDRLKAAVCSYGLMNMVSAYGAVPLQSHLFPDDLFQTGFASRLRINYPAFGVAPWEDPQRYVRWDPIFGMHKVNTPLLLIQSDLDGLPLGQSDEIYSALVRMGKDAQYVRYWGEGHGVASPANARDEWSRVLAWFDEFLDIKRDAEGAVVYEDGRAVSRDDQEPWTAEDFRRLEWFFGLSQETRKTQE